TRPRHPTAGRRGPLRPRCQVNGTPRSPIPGHPGGGRMPCQILAHHMDARMTTRTGAALHAAAVAIFMFSAMTPAVAQNECEREMARAAQTYGVPLGILYAVGLAETGRGGSLRPFALNIDGRAVYEIGRADALRTLEQARRAGARMIDVGCMQINHHFHARNFASAEDMLDPPKNVAYAARFLRELKA